MSTPAYTYSYPLPLGRITLASDSAALTGLYVPKRKKQPGWIAFFGGDGGNRTPQWRTVCAAVCDCSVFYAKRFAAQRF